MHASLFLPCVYRYVGYMLGSHKRGVLARVPVAMRSGSDCSPFQPFFYLYPHTSYKHMTRRAVGLQAAGLQLYCNGSVYTGGSRVLTSTRIQYIPTFLLNIHQRDGLGCCMLYGHTAYSSIQQHTAAYSRHLVLIKCAKILFGPGAKSSHPHA